MLQIIPRSTRFDWDKRDMESSFGYDWFLENKDLFQTLQLIAINRKLLKKNKVLFRVIAISRFMMVNVVGIKAGRNLLKSVAVQNIKKLVATVGIKQALKFTGLNFRHYANLRKNIRCATSVLCRIKHPAQLLQREINMVKSYCQESRYQFWSHCTLFHQMRRDDAAHISLSTFYKYVSLFNLKRSHTINRRKNHAAGIRATAPLQLLHAHLTEFRTEDQNQKNSPVLFAQP